MVRRECFVCLRNFSRKLNVLGVFSKKKKYILVVIRRYVRKYYTLEVSGGSYTVQTKVYVLATRMSISIDKACLVRMTNTGY